MFHTGNRLVLRLFILLSVAVTAAVVHSALFTPSIDLVVELESSEPLEVHAYCNLAVVNPITAYNSKGTGEYRFNDIPPKLDHIRFAVMPQNAEKIVMRRLEFQYSRFYPFAPSKVLANIPFDDWKDWPFVGIKAAEERGTFQAVAIYNELFLHPRVDFSKVVQVDWSLPRAFIWLWLALGIILSFDFVRVRVLPNPEYRQVAYLLALAFILRIIGVNWGMPVGSYRPLPFDDEIFSVNILQSVFRGELVTEGYREGNLIYYIWWLVLTIAKLGGFISYSPEDVVTFDGRFSQMILICRIVNVVLGAGTVFLVYLTIRQISNNPIASLLGALVLTVFPLEVLFPRFMRTHIPGNFFLSLALYGAYRARTFPTMKNWMLAGAACGLAFSVRYNLIVVAIVPGLILLALYFPRLWKAWRETAVLAFSFTLVFFLVNPGFLISPEDVFHRTGKMNEHFARANFVGWNIFDLSLPGRYITNIMPLGMYPLLWIPIYGLGLVAILGKRHRMPALPMLLFGSIYLYAMAKGYFFGFLRATIGLNPVLAVLTGLGADVIRGRLASSGQKILFFGIFTIAVLASGIYSLGHSIGLHAPSSRFLLFQFLESQAIGPEKLDVALVEAGMWFDASRGAVALGEKFHYSTIPATSDFRNAKARCLVLSQISTAFPKTEAPMELLAEKIRATSPFTVKTTIDSTPSIFGISLVKPTGTFETNYWYPRFIVLCQPRPGEEKDAQRDFEIHP